MAGYTSEEEQIEAIRRWWRENGRSVIAGVIIAGVAVVGWQQWRSYREGRALAASGAYQALQGDLGDDNAKAAAGDLASLREEHGGSTYAILAALQMARYDVDHNKLDDAAKQLRWVVDIAGSASFKVLGRMRLAQVLLSQNRPDEAGKVLKPVPKGAFSARFQELLGDVHAAQSDRDAAVAAYRKALAGGLDQQRRMLVQLKLDNLGAVAEPAS